MEAGVLDQCLMEVDDFPDKSVEILKKHLKKYWGREVKKDG
jgi:hypothetical protein